MGNKLSISLFAYNFPHKKTQDIIFHLISKGYEISVIYAANPIKLNIPSSTIKSKYNHIALIHPSIIAKQFGIKYMVVDHDSDELVNYAKDNPGLGIISGARILKSNVIDSFPDGIINFHPGVIPYARGLDALFWSIYNNITLGVTSHLISKQIDAGRIIEIKNIKIYKHDTLLDLSERLYETQLEMLSSTIQKVVLNEGYYLEDYGGYNRKMEPDLERKIPELLPAYIAARLHE